jgi:uncharacterized protein
MTADLSIWSHILMIIGEITLIVISGVVICAFLLVVLSLYSIRSGKMVLPGFLKAGLVLLEGLSKAIFHLFRLEDKEMLKFFILLHNTINKKAFSAIPVQDRAIFFPQCLRSARCPAHLTPEGLMCRNCGQCEIGHQHLLLEGLGYRIFVVPGSSFIKRMVKKYRPRAIIGIGCLTEVKEGIEMSDKMGLVALGVVNFREGCVETIANWDEIFEAAVLGLDPDRVPAEITEKYIHPIAGTVPV